MSHLISRILLAILLFPLASLLYLVVFFYEMRRGDRWGSPGGQEQVWVIAGGVTWLFLAVYWFLLWKASVKLTARRAGLTLFSALAATTAGVLIYLPIEHYLDSEAVGAFVGSATAPLLWLVATCFVWRETADERAARLGHAGRDAVVCPNCGYNLTGLAATRCPECGKQYTINELLAEQPGRAAAEVEVS